MEFEAATFMGFGITMTVPLIVIGAPEVVAEECMFC